MITLGYACINISLGEKGRFKTTTVKSANTLTELERHNKLQSLTRINFEHLLAIMKWNASNNVKQYRVSSDLVPLYTHEINNYEYKEDAYILSLCKLIKEVANSNDISLSIHPSHFNVIGTEKESVFTNTCKQLSHEADLCELLDIQDMCIHVGSKNVDKFISNFPLLPENVQSLLRLENDKTHSVVETLDICNQLNIPMILDYHHDKLKPSNYTLNEVLNTWKDRTPVMHLSSSKDDYKIVNAHHDFVSIADYEELCEFVGNTDIKLEIEAKQKDLAMLYLM